ncbi:hypothetical protein H1W00_12795 [Aeromicrobium sp. Marseille-Q0843]|uniref:Zinc ribbon domain-containing protein n=1 Tax=Aeromicrobium phoceense TaxID=2754045 RepID=A0A838XL75_9ACTN|nr:zinc ribbon domain-containing protein [Aeromicrobium phoceense]MBA4609356.1 hypothetical protein [Aeromicrobium phoceense]
MSTRVDTEQIESTRSEKLLAVLLAAFLLVGAVWFYAKVPAWVDGALPQVDDRAVVQAESRQAEADQARWDAETERDEARLQLDLEREEYKVALQEGEGAADARQEYEEAQAEYDRVDAELEAATAAAGTAEEEAQQAREAYDQENRSGLKAWLVAGIRLAFIAGWTFGAYQLMARLRRRESRYLTLAFAGAAVGAIMALVFAVDYITDYVDPLDLGPFVLSALGVVATVVAFRVLQKHLAARVPGRRVRKGECPFCGFPLHDAGLDGGPHCAGCGRDVIADCASCGAPRRVGSPHCAACGAP